MGRTHVEVLIRNPASTRKTWKGMFLVDAGAIDSLVPGKYLRQIGLKPNRVLKNPDATRRTIQSSRWDCNFIGLLTRR